MKDKVTLEFTREELNVILYGLQKLPFEAVNDIIKSIVSQIPPKQVETSSI